MTSNRFLWVAILVLAGLTGCAMCDNSQDGTYPAFGGKWQRDNPSSGRVGSLFDPAGVRVTDGVVPTEAEPTLAEAEAAETIEGAAPSESVEPSEGTGPKEAAEEARESVLDEPAEQGASSMDEAETTQPERAEGASPVEPAERAKSAKPAKASADDDALIPGLQLPAMPFEMPKTEAPKKDSTNLLPPLDLPSEP